MKKAFLIILITSILSHLNAQVLSGNCSDNLSATIAYDPATDGYLSTQFLPTFQGNQVATGDYKIFPATGNNCNTLKKVVVVVEGFDITNSRNAQDNYNTFSSAAANLQSQGYDVIILNFGDSHDYIERNSFLLVELIKRINNSKVTQDEIVVIGASMGGLVSRFALGYMEANDIPHQC